MLYVFGNRALFVSYILVRQKVGFSRKILASNCGDCGNTAIVANEYVDVQQHDEYDDD